ncbi:MAG: sulfur carrier protein ThiS [Candidatus Brocadiales bacterium]|nr:sulfur carrier protein ThiS [Candidatus Brocadiales bacterium]
MRLIVNGQVGDYPEGITVRRLLEALGIEKKPVAVELNRGIVPRQELDQKLLKENDTLEIVTFVGGG